MDDTDLLAEAERAVAAWAVGDADAAVALGQMCSALESVTGVACVLVGGEEGRDDVVSSESLLPATVARIAAASRPNRALYTHHDARWPSLFASGEMDGAGAAGWEWVACEPALDRDGTLHGMIVAAGRRGSDRDRVLVVLPDVARLCASVLGLERITAVAAKVTHRLNNLLAGVLANVEYASLQLEGASGDEPLLASATPAHRREFVTALENAASAARQLGVQVAEIGRLVRPRT